MAKLQCVECSIKTSPKKGGKNMYGKIKTGK